MDPFHVSYSSIKRISPLVLDYLSGKEELSELRYWSPDNEGLRKAAASRQFDEHSRSVLNNALRRQYEGIPIHDAVQENLDLLRQKDTLTVTTGHQLCLFTGPLYLPLKILNVVRLAREMTKDLHRAVVPVFWMASEDHDRPEIDHAWLNGNKVVWAGEDGGPVGRMRLDGIEPVVSELRELLGDGEMATELNEMISSCYRPEFTLAEATRRSVNALFGRLGIVVLDGDDMELKRLFAPAMREELLNQVGQRSVAYANDKLGTDHKIQATVREINLFHLRPGHRSRIVMEGDRFKVIGGPTFTLDELLKELDERPQDLSPNVLLRPLYQETVLPNLAYVGGAGELAYWLQLRWLFQSMQVPMPVVLMRSGVSFMSAKDIRQWTDLGMSSEDLFEDIDKVRSDIAQGAASFNVEIGEEQGRLNAFYDLLLERAVTADASLKGSVEARRVQASKGLERIGKGFVRAAKREQQVLLQRVDRIHQNMFPGGQLQERRNNILPLIAAHGEVFLDELMEHLDPLDAKFTVLVDPVS